MEVLSNVFSSIYDFIVDILSRDAIIDVIQAIIIGLIQGMILSNVFLKERKIGKRLSTYGINDVKVDNGELNAHSQRLLFAEGVNSAPSKVRLWFLTGVGFFMDYRKRMFKLIDDNKCDIQILVEDISDCSCLDCYDVNGDGRILEDKVETLVNRYYDIIEGKIKNVIYSESTFLMLIDHKYNKYLEDKSKKEEKVKDKIREILISRDYHGDHTSQILYIDNLVKNAKPNKGTIEVRHYKDEYRMPMIIGEFHQERDGMFVRAWNKLLSRPNEDIIRVWTNFNAPATETRDSISIKAEKYDGEKAEFVVDCVKSFDYVWNKYKK